MVRLDDVPALVAGVDVAKIDVQGAEAAVWRGMAGIRAASPTLVATVEHWPAALHAAGTDPDDLLDTYLADGFRVEVLPSGAPFPRPLDRDVLAAACAIREDAQVTLVLTPRTPAP